MNHRVPFERMAEEPFLHEHILFASGVPGGAYPGDNSRRVEASGKLALSMLQARLIDLNCGLGLRRAD
jgi:hypothetical protein